MGVHEASIRISFPLLPLVQGECLLSVSRFRRLNLKGARSITFNEAVSSGAYVANLLKRIRLAEELRPKIVPAENRPGPGKVAGVVARGEAELGIVITTDIVADPSVDFVGTALCS